MIVWPASVPWRVALPFEVTGPPDAVVETQFDKGPSQRRRNTSAGLSTVQVTLAALTPVQLAALEQWHYSVLGSGTLPFEVADPRNGILRTWQFASPLTVTSLTKTLYRVTFTLHLYPDRL